MGREKVNSVKRQQALTSVIQQLRRDLNSPERADYRRLVVHPDKGTRRYVRPGRSERRAAVLV